MSTQLDVLDLQKYFEADGTSSINLDRRIDAPEPTFSSGIEDVADDTFGEVDGTAIADHVPDLGFGGWETSHDGDTDQAKIEFGSATSVVWGEPIIRCQSDVVDDEFDAYMECFRGASDDAQQGGVLWFNFADTVVGFGGYTLYNQPEGMCFRWKRQSSSLVSLLVGRYDGGSNTPVDEVILATGVSYPTSTSLRLGVTVSGKTVTCYTEPAGGGTRTVHGTYTVPDEVDYQDGNHKRFGFGWFGTNFAFSATGASRCFINPVHVTSTSVTSSHTDFELPYAIATDGSEGTVVVVRKDTQEVLASTRPDTTTVAVFGIDLSEVPVWVGLQYEFSFKPTTIYRRGQNGEASAVGRLQLGYMDVDFGHQTRSFTVTVTPLGRASKSHIFLSDDPSEGKLHVPLLSRNDYATIRIHDSTPFDCFIQGIQWEGEFTTTRFTRGSHTNATGSGNAAPPA